MGGSGSNTDIQMQEEFVQPWRRVCCCKDGGREMEANTVDVDVDCCNFLRGTVCKEIKPRLRSIKHN